MYSERESGYLYVLFKTFNCKLGMSCQTYMFCPECLRFVARNLVLFV